MAWVIKIRPGVKKEAKEKKCSHCNHGKIRQNSNRCPKCRVKVCGCCAAGVRLGTIACPK